MYICTRDRPICWMLVCVCVCKCTHPTPHYPLKEDEMVLEELKPWRIILENIGIQPIYRRMFNTIKLSYTS